MVLGKAQCRTRIARFVAGLCSVEGYLDDISGLAIVMSTCEGIANTTGSRAQFIREMMTTITRGDPLDGWGEGCGLCSTGYHVPVFRALMGSGTGLNLGPSPRKVRDVPRPFPSIWSHSGPLSPIAPAPTPGSQGESTFPRLLLLPSSQSFRGVVPPGDAGA
jgi:hypothetical protein